MILQNLAAAFTGVGMTIWPGDPTFGLEIQRDSVTIAILPPQPLTGCFFIDFCANDGTSHTYQARHVRMASPSSNPGDWFAVGSGKATDLDPSVVAAAVNSPNSWPQVSTGANPQGSILPVPVDPSVISIASGGGTTGHMWITISTSATYPLLRPDGSTLNAPASSAYDRPAAPTLSQVASGALGARTLFARVAYVKRNPENNNTTMYRTSAESSLAVSANNLLKITSPAAVVGYDGYVVLVGTATNAEVIQQRGGGGGASDDGIIAFGTDWTEPAGGAQSSSTVRTPYNAGMDSGLTITERAASTTYKLYLYFDPLVGTGGAFRVGSTTVGVWPTAADDGAASEQNADGHYAMSLGPTFSFTTPAAGGSGGGSGGGGKLR